RLASIVQLFLPGGRRWVVRAPKRRGNPSRPATRPAGSARRRAAAGCLRDRKRHRRAMRIEIAEGGIVIDAEQLAPLLNVAAGDLPELMRSKAVTGICERGVDADEGRYRLSFFYRNRRLRLSVAPD